MKIPKLFQSTKNNEESIEKEAFRLGEIGAIGLKQSAGEIYEEFIPKLRFPYATKIYQEMADNDPVVGAVMYLAEMLMRKTTWDVEAFSDKKKDKEAAEFLRSCMDDMEESWNDTIIEILSFLTYGFSVHEIVYKRRNGQDYSLYNDGKIGWKKIPIRSQSSISEWIIDDKGKFIAVEQQPEPTYTRFRIPANKVLLFRTRIARNNPEGKSLLRNAYRPWYYKKRIEEIEAIGIERDLAGLPVIIPKEGVDVFGADAKAKSYLRAAKNIVSSIRRDKNEGIVLPFGWELKLLSTGGSRQFDTNAIINRYDQRIAMTLLSDLVMMGQNSVGSFALADVKKTLLAAALEAQAQNIADTFNKHAVPKLMKFNFPNLKGYPKIVVGEIESPDIRELGLYFKNLGINIMQDLELYNFMLSLIDGPQMTEEQFEELKAKREAPETPEQSSDINIGTKPEEVTEDVNGDR